MRRSDGRSDGLVSAGYVPSARVVLGRAEPKCRVCWDDGWVRSDVPVGHPEFGRPVRCECKSAEDRRRLVDRARAASDVTSAMCKQTFANFDGRDNPEALSAARAWAERDPEKPWLVLWGPTGTGKTHLLAAALSVIQGREDPDELAIYALTPALLDHIRDGYDDGDYGARFRALRESPVLLLDDLGAERETPWTQEALFKLLDHRYRAGLRTAMATNVLLDDLEPRIASRMQDVDLAVCVQMRGKDRRRASRRVVVGSHG